MKLIILLISLNLFANYGLKTDVEKCISKSFGKLVVPDDAGFMVFKTCVPPQICIIIPSEFNCIYYKFQGDIVVPDPTKKANYDARIADSDKIKSSYQESQFYFNIQQFCIYYANAECSAIPIAQRNSIANSLSFTLGKPLIFIKKMMSKRKK